MNRRNILALLSVPFLPIFARSATAAASTEAPQRVFNDPRFELLDVYRYLKITIVKTSIQIPNLWWCISDPPTAGDDSQQIEVRLFMYGVTAETIVWADGVPDGKIVHYAADGGLYVLAIGNKKSA